MSSGALPDHDGRPRSLAGERGWQTFVGAWIASRASDDAVTGVRSSHAPVIANIGLHDETLLVTSTALTARSSQAEGLVTRRFVRACSPNSATGPPGERCAQAVPPAPTSPRLAGWTVSAGRTRYRLRLIAGRPRFRRRHGAMAAIGNARR